MIMMMMMMMMMIDDVMGDGNGDFLSAFGTRWRVVGVRLDTISKSDLKHPFLNR